MSDLYSNIHALCEKEGIKDGTLCGKIGIRRSFLSELKSGRTKSLSAENLSKIAFYFGVSVDELLTGEQKETTPAPQSQIDADMEWIKQQLMAMPADKRTAVIQLIKNSVK